MRNEYIAKGPVLYFVSQRHKDRFNVAVKEAGWPPNDRRFCAFLFLVTMAGLLWSTLRPTIDFARQSAAFGFDLDPLKFTAYELETIRLAFDLLNGQGYCRIGALVSAAR